MMMTTGAINLRHKKQPWDIYKHHIVWTKNFNFNKFPLIIVIVNTKYI